MKVNKIELGETVFQPDSSQHQANVTMNMTGKSGASFDLSFTCFTTQPKHCPPRLVQYGLIKHAIEQTRLLPAFRGPGNALRLNIGRVQIEAA